MSERRYGVNTSANILIVFIFIGALVIWIFMKKFKITLDEQLVAKHDLKNAAVGFATLVFVGTVSIIIYLLLMN